MYVVPSLNGLRVFEAAGRRMSFTAAADELCVTQGAVSRAVRSLEENLGVKLFHRHVRRLEFTDEGRSLWLSVHESITALERAVLRVSRKGSASVLTVSVLPTFAVKWLMPRLSDFNARYPDIEVRLTTTIKPVDFGLGDIDVAIRVGQPGVKLHREGLARIDLSMVENLADVQMVKLLSDELIPVAAPGLVGSNGLQRLADVRSHKLLYNITRPDAWTDWFVALGEDPPEIDDGPYFGHLFLTIQAAARGQGIALVPSVLVEEELTTGSLVIAYDSSISSQGSYYFLAPPASWDMKKVRTFREWLISEVESEQGSRGSGCRQASV